MMKKIIYIISFIFCLGLNAQTLTTLDSLKGFWTAEGFGRMATGARGLPVYKVTSLSNSGAGTLRQAITDASSGGYVFFEIAGTITLTSSLSIPANCYIAGQTAFRNAGQGITLRQNETYNGALISNVGNNSIIRYLRLRRGAGVNDEVNGDNITITNGRDIMIDHCSLSWSTDESFNTWGSSAYDITIQNSIIAESLMWSTHSYSTDPTDPQYPRPHSMGLLVGNGSYNISLYRNLFAHNNQRNPLIGGEPGPGDDFEMRNNIIYNSGEFPTVFQFSDSNFSANIENNYHKDGGDTSTSRGSILLDPAGSNKFHVSGNINPDRPTSGDDDWDAVKSDAAPYNITLSTSYQEATPFNFPLQNAPLLTIAEMDSEMLPDVGASLYEDAVDVRIKGDYENGTGGLIDDPSEVGGWPTIADMSSVPIDTDDDGIPDAFESEHSITDANAVKEVWYFSSDDHYVDNQAGYTNIEMYLMYLTGELLENAEPYDPEPEGTGTVIRASGGLIRTSNGTMRIISN